MNPNQIINNFIMNNPAVKNNPIVQNALSLVQSGNQKALQDLVENVAKEKGVDLNSLKEYLKSNLQI